MIPAIFSDPSFNQSLIDRQKQFYGALTASQQAQRERQTAATTVTQSEKSENRPESRQNKGFSELTDEEKKQIAELKATDQKVRAHEQAHLSAAAGIAVSGASFEYQRGPDGQRYAVGGEVSIDTSTIPDDPSANLQKADQIRRAALAPADPSPTDRNVASQATTMAAKAQVELAKMRFMNEGGGSVNTEGKQNNSGNDSNGDDRKEASSPIGNSRIGQQLAQYLAPQRPELRGSILNFAT